MSLVFAGITPHPPLLLPHVGKEKGEKLEQTKKALLQLEQEFYLARPQVVIVIAPHESLFEDAFAVNAHNHLHASFNEFGDLETKKEWVGAPALAAKIQHRANIVNVPTKLVSGEKLGHGVSIPLLTLTSHVEKIQVLPLGYSLLSSKQHLEFGELLKEVIMESDKRIALIASGDLSHTHSPLSPKKMHPDGKVFDDTLINLLQTRNTVGIASMNETMIKNADECVYRSILIALGVLQHMDYTFKNYSYEAPYGVGYLTGQFVF